MQFLPIESADLELIQQAKDIIRRRYRADYHHVGAAVCSKAGQVVSGVHVEANVSRVTICAEAVAIGAAITQGMSDLDTIVAVRRDDHDPAVFYVVSPCGVCREMINDYMPDGFCLCVEDGILVKVRAEDLLPVKYVRAARVKI
jgi:cytidine deaminase